MRHDESVNQTILLLPSHIVAQSDAISSRIIAALFALSAARDSLVAVAYVRHSRSGVLGTINQFFVDERFKKEKKK